MSKQCYRSFIRITEYTFNSNPSKFWEFVGKNRSSQSIPKTVMFNGVASININDFASLFSIHFNSVCSNSYVDYVLPSFTNFFHDLPSNYLFDLRQVEDGLAKLKYNKSIGPDGLSGIFLYAIRSSLHFPLWFQFRKILSSGVYPEIFKLSSVTPSRVTYLM